MKNRINSTGSAKDLFIRTFVSGIQDIKRISGLNGLSKALQEILRSPSPFFTQIDRIHDYVDFSDEPIWPSLNDPNRAEVIDEDIADLLDAFSQLLNTPGFDMKNFDEFWHICDKARLRVCIDLYSPVPARLIAKAMNWSTGRLAAEMHSLEIAQQQEEREPYLLPQDALKLLIKNDSQYDLHYDHEQYITDCSESPGYRVLRHS